jgi:hypothetical protein
MAGFTPFPIPFTEVNFHDSKSITQVYNHLTAARRLAVRKGLQPGLRFTLDLVIPASNPAANGRPLPPIPAQSSTPLRLHRPLQTGPNKLSQVWLAVVEEDPECDAAETFLVLKIIQPSMCPYPGIDDHWAFNYIFPERLASEEAEMYEQLAHKQGRAIPYFFGIHTVRLPYQNTFRTSHPR